MHNRSSAYQYLFWERSYSQEALDAFTTNEGLYVQAAFDEETKDLLAQLHRRYWEIAKKTLTMRQFAILDLLRMGFSQAETAKTLKCTQSTINKSIWGNDIYCAQRKRYGGIAKAWKNAARTDPEVLAILQKLRGE
jgi:hypothetical protein